MFTKNILVEVEFENGETKEVDIDIDIKEFEECENKKEKKKYIKDETKKQHQNVKKVNITKHDINEIQSVIDDINDTSDLHPNESYDEFMEHEDFDDEED